MCMMIITLARTEPGDESATVAVLTPGASTPSTTKMAFINITQEFPAATVLVVTLPSPIPNSTTESVKGTMK